MTLSRLKFPFIKSSRNSELNIENEINLINRLNSPKGVQRYKFIKIPKNIRAINYYNSKNRIDNNSTKIDTSNNINNNYNSVQTLLSKNLSLNSNLKPKIDLKKCISMKNVIRNKILSLNQSKISKRRNESEENDISLFLNKLDRIYGINRQMGKIKRVNDISKELIKKDENNTNGNEIYNSTEEEQKDSITYILDKDDTKKMLKIKLTKLKPKNKFNFKKIQDMEKFHLKIPKYIPYGFENIRKIKYFQNLAQERLKIDNTPKMINYMQLNDLKLKKFRLVLKKKMENLGNQMENDQLDMKNIDKQIESCIQRARNNLDFYSEKIIEE
jgi:hypothetical protein